MDLSVIIVSWNTRDLLRSCLESAFRAVDDLKSEVIVVDNGSADDSAEMVAREFPRTILIRNETNRGFTAANNQAIRASRGRHLLLLNSDTLVLPGALRTMVRFLDLHTRVGIVGARLLNSDGSLQPSWAEFPTIWSELIGKNFRTRRVYQTVDGTLAYEVDWVGGACLMIRRAALDQIGLLDERFFMYSEEADWCFRAGKIGWTVCYHAQAEVTHLGGQSSRLHGQQMKAQLYRSKLLFFRKHYGLRQAILLRTLLWAASVFRLAFSWLHVILKPRSLRVLKSTYEAR